MAQNEFGKVSADEKFIHYLMDIEKANRDHLSALEYAREEGELKGELKGRLESKLEGKFEGKLEGKLEGKFEIAAKMTAKGLPASFIVELTGLSIDEVNQISLLIQNTKPND